MIASARRKIDPSVLTRQSDLAAQVRTRKTAVKPEHLEVAVYPNSSDDEGSYSCK